MHALTREVPFRFLRFEAFCKTGMTSCLMLMLFGSTGWLVNGVPIAGFLDAKTDADQKAVEWTHTLAGRLDARLGARGLLTDYGYENAGRLDSIDYSDTTPDVGIIYDQRNRPSQITDAAGTRTQDYSDAGQFEGEIISGGVLDGFSIVTDYDSLQRKNAFSVSRGSTVLASTDWTHDALSRMESVTQGNDSGTYTYHPNSSLPNTLTLKRGATTTLEISKTFDTLDRLDVLTNTPATGPPIVFDYAYNAAGLRETITSADNAFWTIGYNDRAEVTSGVRKPSNQTPFPGQEFGYQFDSIGNRLTATANSRVSTYTPNAVNEYESRTVPGYLNILGEAASDTEVTVNGTAAERLGTYFHAEVATPNTASPVFATVETLAERQTAGEPDDEGQPTIQTESASVLTTRFLPQTPESFTHDDDGNLASDGRWTNVWDAENRLIQQTTTASAAAGGAPNLKLVNLYDYAGRRIQKTVSEWNGTTWTQKYSLNFLYDGWNLVAEVSANNGPILRSYAWGADLSGGEAAGGIGGLAFIRYHLEEKSLAVAADAQGNTAALYDMANGTQVASYEYGPFGEPLRASGLFAEVNPFRFSTKYEDPETGWLYYGYRFYNPTTGRWLSRDPIGENGGINLYGFVSNNSINLIDPLGLLDFSTLWQNYPTPQIYPTSNPAPGQQTIWDKIGGKVAENANSGVFTNSCAIRMSDALNTSGEKIAFDKGKTVSGSNGDWYYFRVADLHKYLNNKLGAPLQFTPQDWRSGIGGQTGILNFQNNWSDATGHIVLFNGSNTIDGKDFSTDQTAQGVQFYPVK